MSEIEKFRREIEETERKKAEELEAHRKERLVSLKRAVEGAIGKELLDEFQPRYYYYRGHPVVELQYKGYKEIMSWPQPNREKLASIIATGDKLEQQWLEKQKVKRNYLIDRLQDTEYPTVYALKSARDSLKEYQLTDDPEISQLVQRYEEALQSKQAREKVEAQAKLLEEQERRQRHRAEMLQVAKEAATWAELEPLARLMDYQTGSHEYMNDPELSTEYREAQARLRKLDEERAEQRDRLTQKAFRPWRYYVVYYARGDLDPEYGEPTIQSRKIYSLTAEPDENGWWYPMSDSKRPVKLVSAYKVEQVDVTHHSDQPYWTPTVKAECGSYPVPPENAQRI